MLNCSCPKVSTCARLQEHIEQEPDIQLEQLCKDPQQPYKYIEKGQQTENESQLLEVYPALPLAHSFV